jgi:hypothetical protein
VKQFLKFALKVLGFSTLPSYKMDESFIHEPKKKLNDLNQHDDYGHRPVV